MPAGIQCPETRHTADAASQTAPCHGEKVNLLAARLSSEHDRLKALPGTPSAQSDPDDSWQDDDRNADHGTQPASSVDNGRMAWPGTMEPKPDDWPDDRDEKDDESQNPGQALADASPITQLSLNDSEHVDDLALSLADTTLDVQPSRAGRRKGIPASAGQPSSPAHQAASPTVKELRDTSMNPRYSHNIYATHHPAAETPKQPATNPTVASNAGTDTASSQSLMPNGVNPTNQQARTASKATQTASAAASGAAAAARDPASAAGTSSPAGAITQLLQQEQSGNSSGSMWQIPSRHVPLLGASSGSFFRPQRDSREKFVAVGLDPHSNDVQSSRELQEHNP